MPDDTILDDPFFKERIDNSGEFFTLPQNDRKAAKNRAIAKKERWSRANEIRANWSPEQFIAEEQELAREIAQILESRNDQSRPQPQNV